MMKKIPLKIWLPVTVAILTAVGLAVFFILSRHGKPPQTSVPTAVQEEKIALPEGVVWNVAGAEGIASEVQGKIKRAVYESEVVNSIAKELSNYAQELSIDNLAVEGDWAVLDAAPRWKDSGELAGTEGIVLLARRIGTEWKVTAPRDSMFFEWLPSVPESLIPSETKEYLKGWHGGQN
jgi:hypothetical protein